MDLPVHQIHSPVGIISVSVSLWYNPFLYAPSSLLLLLGNLLRTSLLLGSLHAVSRLCLDNSYLFVLMTTSPPAFQLFPCWHRPPALSLDRSDSMYSHRSQLALAERTTKETQRPTQTRAGKAPFCWMGTWDLPEPWHWAKFTRPCCVSSVLNLPEALKAFSPFPARVIQAEGSSLLLLLPVPGKGGVQGGPCCPHSHSPAPEHWWVPVCSSNSVLKIAQHVLAASWEPSGSLSGLKVGKGGHYQDKQQQSSVLGLGVEAISHTFEENSPRGLKEFHNFFFLHKIYNKSRPY